jgi:glutathione S-transferase
MNLFYHPGACSLAAHIALIEARMPYELVSITREKRTSDGRDFLKINPKGFIPALELDDGTVLSETFAILVYVAHQAGTLLPESGLIRWRALEATSFMTTEIHSNFKPFFYADATSAEKERARAKLLKHFALLDEQLGENSFLLGEQMTMADPYLFVMLLWAANKGLEVSERLSGYAARMKRVPSFAKALAEEGLA